MAKRSINFRQKVTTFFGINKRTRKFWCESNEEVKQENIFFQMKLEVPETEPEISLLLSKMFGSDLVNLYQLTIFCLARKFEVVFHTNSVKIISKFMAIIFWGKYIVLIVSKYLWNFFSKYFIISSHHILAYFFGTIICKLYHNNSVKIYVNISSPPPQLQKIVDFWEKNSLPLSVNVENG